ncbi:uncharacterized protein LOC124848714 [Vigna umbellata]|uniref:uncharacterized protein LOC124848714 n=1 Tax=Vigna umbellata TaxID=87088 RepID=UPI001F5F9953|nr:uncharacterized protein LOC124848714 [Vigna umbellata]
MSKDQDLQDVDLSIMAKSNIAITSSEQDEKQSMRFLNIKKTNIDLKGDQKMSKDQDLQDVDLSIMAKSNIAITSSEQDEKQSMRYLNNGCSRHMTSDPTRFTSLSHKTSGHVTFGDNNKGKIIGIGKIQTSSSYEIENVLLVLGLKHNLQISASFALCA